MSDSTTMVKIQLPIEIGLRDALKKKSKALGFGSVQDYIRVWATNEVKKSADITDIIDDWGEPSPAALKRFVRIGKDIEMGKNLSRSFDNVDDLMSDLMS
jgi:hypothetical protein